MVFQLPDSHMGAATVFCQKQPNNVVPKTFCTATLTFWGGGGSWGKWQKNNNRGSRIFSEHFPYFIPSIWWKMSRGMFTGVLPRERIYGLWGLVEPPVLKRALIATLTDCTVNFSYKPMITVAMNGTGKTPESNKVQYGVRCNFRLRFCWTNFRQRCLAVDTPEIHFLFHFNMYVCAS